MTPGKKTHRDIIKGWSPFTDEEIHRYVSKGYWENLTVCDCLDRNVDRFPDKLAVIDDSEEVTWRQLQQRSVKLADKLLRLGIAYGDFFVLQMQNSVHFFYMYFALNRIGAVPVMCVPRHRRLEIEHSIRLHEAKGICVPADREKFDYVGMVEQIGMDRDQLKTLLTDKEPAPPGWLSIQKLLRSDDQRLPFSHLDQLKPDPNDICTEQLSGGTTGLPKSVPRTHNDYH